jgi:hypothetical protein
MEHAPKTPTEEITDAIAAIEDLMARTDTEIEHLDTALATAREVFARYEHADGDEDFDAALDTLMSTIENTTLYEQEIQGRSSARASNDGESEEFAEAA